MSIQRCEYCQCDIDTDFDAEHFDSDDYRCILEEQEKCYNEGDTCPECGGMCIITQCNGTGVCYVVCQDCRLDVTEMEK